MVLFSSFILGGILGMVLSVNAFRLVLILGIVYVAFAAKRHLVAVGPHWDLLANNFDSDAFRALMDALMGIAFVWGLLLAHLFFGH